MSVGQSLTGAAPGPADVSATAVSLLDDLLSSPLDPVLVFDAQDRLQAYNQAADTLFDLGAFRGRPLAAIAALQPVLEAPTHNSVAGPVWDSGQGRAFAVQRAATPSGGFLLGLREVTELKLLDRRLADFMHIVSHDLRTPLTALKLYSELLVDEYYGEMGASQQNAMNRIMLSIYGMVNLVDNLQASDRYDPRKGLYETQRNPVDLAGVAEEVLLKLTLPADILKVTLQLTVDPNLAIIRGDRLMLECALVNLVDNALKYSPANSTVAIDLSSQDDAVLIAVADHGPGIALEHQTRIFERSVRVEVPGMRVRGSGLGLFVVNSVAERHGGSVWVESTPGEGSTFYLKLPVRGTASGG